MKVHSDNKTLLFKKWNEGPRHQKPLFRVIPANQGFAAHNPACIHVHLWLVIRLKFPLFHRGGQPSLQPLFKQGLIPHLLII